VGRGSSVTLVGLGYGLHDLVSIPDRGKLWHFFSSPRQDKFWGSQNLHSNDYSGSYLGSKASGRWSWPL